MNLITRIFGNHLDICREGTTGIVHALTGTAAVSASVNVVGTGTAFLTELIVGDTITVGGVSKVVATITSNTAMTVTVAFAGVLSAQALVLIRDAAEGARPNDTEANWQKLGDVEDLSIKPAVESEEVMAPKVSGGYHRKAKITKMANLDFGFTVNDISELVFELVLLTAGAVTTTGEPMSGDGRIRGWFRVKQRDEEGTLINFITVWGELQIEGDLAMGNSVPKPKMIISVLENSLNLVTLSLAA